MEESGEAGSDRAPHRNKLVPFALLGGTIGAAAAFRIQFRQYIESGDFVVKLGLFAALSAIVWVCYRYLLTATWLARIEDKFFKGK